MKSRITSLFLMATLFASAATPAGDIRLFPVDTLIAQIQEGMNVALISKAIYPEAASYFQGRADAYQAMLFNVRTLDGQQPALGTASAPRRAAIMRPVLEQ